MRIQGVSLLLTCCLVACAAPDPSSAPGQDASSVPPEAASGGAADDAFAGDHFRARGNEPFWAIDVEGRTLHFATPDLPDGRTLQAQRMAHSSGVAFSGTDAGTPFNLDLTRTACTDSMSGEAFEFTATWDYGGQRMHGCARRSD